MVKEASSELVTVNIAFLEQALALVHRLDDAAYCTSPPGFEPYRVGSHMRHLLEFYECFQSGLADSQIDYDARTRDESIERDRHAAARRISSIMDQVQRSSFLPYDRAVSVRVENSDAGVYLASSIGRELQALSSHTVHHFALIAVTLRLHGIAVDPDFGMSRSTLRHQATKAQRTGKEST